MIRVMLVDDQAIILEGLKTIISAQPDMTVVKTASDGREAIDGAKLGGVDLILMDVRMPLVDGVRATKEIKDIDANIKILLLSTFVEDQYIVEALNNGADGYLLKETPPDKILDTIREAIRGGTHISPEAASKLVKHIEQSFSKHDISKDNPKINLLTQRELEICSYVGKGYSNKEISDSMYISEGTVKNHLTNILAKLDLRDRTQLAIFALKSNIIRP